MDGWMDGFCYENFFFFDLTGVVVPGRPLFYVCECCLSVDWYFLGFWLLAFFFGT